MSVLPGIGSIGGVVDTAPNVMILTYVTHDMTNEGAAGAITVQVGDLLIGFSEYYSISSSSDVSESTPSGWTLITSVSGFDDFNNRRIKGALFYKIATGTSESFEYFGGNPSGTDSNLIIAYRPAKAITTVTVTDTDTAVKKRFDSDTLVVDLDASGLIAGVGGLMIAGISVPSVVTPIWSSSDALTVVNKSESPSRAFIMSYHLHDAVTALLDTTTNIDPDQMQFGTNCAATIKLE